MKNKLIIHVFVTLAFLYDILSKIASISLGSLTSTEMGCEVVRESRSRAGAIMSKKNWSIMRQSGRMCSTPRYSIQLANPSFSQRSFHQVIVTRFPNHWCA